MSKKSCELIKDLLPLYVDDVCSEESRKMVTEHLASCGNCRDELNKMKTELNITEKADKDIKAFRKIKRRLLVGKIIAALVGAFLIFQVCGALMINWVNTFVPVNYAKYDLGNHVTVEEDEDGKVWLVKTGAASAEGTVNYFVRPSGSDIRVKGPYLSKSDESMSPLAEGVKDADKVDLVMNIVEPKYQHFFDRYNMLIYRSNSVLTMQTERTLVADLNTPNENGTYSKLNAVYYYDIDNDEEHLLWEKK